jgi:hypothetical protein
MISFTNNTKHMDNNSFEASYRAFMAALFVGVADALLCLIYNVIYRSGRPYFSSSIINVSYIIFGILFLFAMIGLVYLFALRLFRQGNLIFMFLMIIVSTLAILAIHSGNFSSNLVESQSLRAEATGITVIAGFSATVGIPLLHGSHKFELYVV